MIHGNNNLCYQNAQRRTLFQYLPHRNIESITPAFPNNKNRVKTGKYYSVTDLKQLCLYTHTYKIPTTLSPFPYNNNPFRTY